ncbi:hypothetical protein Trydic_g13610 [Trypoxylus dichotomus]
MKLKHYPGKAVIDDPAWLEMDIPNSARGRLYEANWIDTQRNLSNSSTSSYDYGSIRGISKLSQYQTLQDDVSDKGKGDQDPLYANTKNMTGSMRLKYHSEKCLSRINSKTKKDFNQHYNDDYYLPSQTRLKREQSLKKEAMVEHLYAQIKPKNCDKKAADAPPEPKPRKKIPQTNPTEQYKNVINDLEKQIKKSVRFNERKTEIGEMEISIENGEDQEDDEDVYSEVFHWEDSNVHAVDDLDEEESPDKSEESEEDKAEELKEEVVEKTEESQERTSEWVEEQNKYFLDEETENNTTVESAKEKVDDQPEIAYPNETTLNRNDSGYYESPKKIRQRIPPRKIYPSSSELSESASSGAGNRSDTESCSSCENVEVFDIYKNGRSSPLRHPPYNQNYNSAKHSSNSKAYRNSGGNDSGNDFLIPRPKLIVPIHSYAIRKRRTGNLHKQSVSYSDYENICATKTTEIEDDVMAEGKEDN